jgi:site-specific DNA recombinase
MTVKNKRKGPKAKHIMAGYVFCADCDTKMYVHHKATSNTYRCTKCNNHIMAKDLEEIYHEQLKTFLLTGVSVSEYLETLDIELQEKEKLLSVLESERDSLSKKMDNFINMRMNNELSKEVFAEKYKPMEERLLQISNQLPELQAEIDFLKIQHRSSDVVLKDATDLYSCWDTLEFDDKRTIIETITDKISVGKEDIHIKLSYLPTKNANTRAADAALKTGGSDPNLSNQNPVKRQSNHMNALPFSRIDIVVPFRCRWSPRQPKPLLRIDK